VNQSENSIEGVLEIAATLYKTKKEDITKIGGGYQNKIYEYKVGGINQILRITKGYHRELDLLKSELDFIESFNQAGISVSLPGFSINKKYIEEVLVDNEKFYITSFSKAEGRSVNVTDPNEWNEDFFQHWGQTMGKMHALVKEKKKTYQSYKRHHWGSNENQISEITNFISSISLQMVDSYKSLIKKIDLLSKDDDTYGLIHNDFHQGNFFVKDGHMTIFDFDDCGFNWFAQDIAVSFYHAVWQGMSFNPDNQSFPHQFLEGFVSGYCKECELKKETLEQVPLFLKLREVFLYTLFNKKWDLENLESWQEYTLKDLKLRIEKDIPYTDVNFSSFI
jgi:Ser/Thr protein kinase RdoA (MazF antagonist)